MKQRGNTPPHAKRDPVGTRGGRNPFAAVPPALKSARPSIPSSTRKGVLLPGSFKRIYNIVADIPKGKVITYGGIAEYLGGGLTGRVVGFAMRAGPPGAELPYHRVVNRLGEMAPGLIFGGEEKQRKLLKKEGVAFRPDGCIDLAKSRWDPNETS